MSQEDVKSLIEAIREEDTARVASPTPRASEHIPASCAPPAIPASIHALEETPLEDVPLRNDDVPAALEDAPTSAVLLEEEQKTVLSELSQDRKQSVQIEPTRSTVISRPAASRSVVSQSKLHVVNQLLMLMKPVEDDATTKEFSAQLETIQRDPRGQLTAKKLWHGFESRIFRLSQPSLNPKLRLVWTVCTFLLCIALISCQLLFIDFFSSWYIGDLRWLGWLAADGAVVLTFFTFFVWYCVRIRQCWREPAAMDLFNKIVKLNFAWILWLVYSTIFCAKIFTANFLFANSIPNGQLDVYRGIITVITVVFMLLALSENYEDLESPREKYISSLLKEIPIDLLDSVQLMDFLYASIQPLPLSYGTQVVIVIVACINFILPALALWNLKYAVDESEGETSAFCSPMRVYFWVDSLFTNIPSLIIRAVILSHSWGLVGNNMIIIFLVKNVVGFINSFRAFLVLGFKQKKKAKVSPLGKSDPTLNEKMG